MSMSKNKKNKISRSHKKLIKKTEVRVATKFLWQYMKDEYEKSGDLKKAVNKCNNMIEKMLKEHPEKKHRIFEATKEIDKIINNIIKSYENEN